MPSAVETDKRRRELAAIHVGAKALGLDDETYRDMVAHVAGKRSAGKLGAARRRKVLDYLRGQGAAPKRGFRRAGAVARQATARPSPGP